MTPAIDPARHGTPPWAATGLVLRTPWFYAVSLVLLAALVAGFIWHDLGAAYRGTLAYWNVRLSGSAEEQIRVITLWLNERRRDAEVVAEAPPTVLLLSAPASKGKAAQTYQQGVQQELKRIAKGNGYVGGAVVDLESRIRARTGSLEGTEDFRPVCAWVFRTREFEVIASDLQQGKAWLYLAVPVFAENGARRATRVPSRVVGAVVLVVDPWKEMLPFITSESEPAHTAETVLVWRQGGDAVIFSPLRKILRQPSLFRRPLGEVTFECRVAREGDVSFGEFADYRGIRVFGAARRIHLAGDNLARKVDRNEALSAYHRRAVLEGLVGFLSLLLFGFAIVIQHRQTAMQGLREKVKQQHVLLELREELQRVMASIPDYLWSGDVDGRGNWTYRYYSSVVEKITGRPAQFYLQGPDAWLSTVHPDDRPRMLACHERIRGGQITRQDNEYRIVMPDGAIRWVLDSVKVRRQNGRLRIDGVVSDITESKQVTEALRREAAFDELMTKILARFATCPYSEVDPSVIDALRATAEFIGVDHAYVVVISPDRSTWSATHEWCGPNLSPRLQQYQNIPFGAQPWSESRLLAGEIIRVNRRNDLPPEASAECRHYEAEGAFSALDVPMRAAAGVVRGCVGLQSNAGPVVWSDSDIAHVKMIGDAIGSLLERRRAEEELQRSFERLRALAARLQSIREEERKRLAREIHDQLGQALTAIKIDLTSLIRELPAADTQRAARTSSILKLVDETIHAVRRIATELRPGILDDLGLVATVEWAGEEFEARTGTKCRLDLPQEDIVMDPERATAVFRIFQETLTNVARHASASEVQVRLAVENSDLTLEVHDNGKGISEDRLSHSESLGILGMRERATLLGGKLTIHGAPGDGTTVRVRIPQAQGAQREVRP